MSQTGSDVGPAAAAVATHWRFVQTITKNSTTSNSVRLRHKFIGYIMSSASSISFLASADIWIHMEMPKNGNDTLKQADKSREQSQIQHRLKANFAGAVLRNRSFIKTGENPPLTHSPNSDRPR
jgi:hypothetical protein